MKGNHMRLNAGDIHQGMPVYGIDGELLGRVDDVRVGASAEATSSDSIADVEIETVTIAQSDVTGARHELRIPARAICILFPGQNVTVEYTRELCARLFLDGASALGNESHPVGHGQEEVKLLR